MKKKLSHSNFLMGRKCSIVASSTLFNVRFRKDKYNVKPAHSRCVLQACKSFSFIGTVKAMIRRHGECAKNV